MAKAIVHARNSAEKFGGGPDDYFDIHEFIDSSREVFPDYRHRAITHTNWFISKIVPLKFGEVRLNSEGREYSVREVAEQHVLEDFDGKFIPSVQDYLSTIPPDLCWMDGAKNGALPPSQKVEDEKTKATPQRKSSSGTGGIFRGGSRFPRRID